MKTYRWASLLACLAMVVAVKGAFAEEDKKDDAQRHEAQRQSTDDDSQTRDEDRDRDDQDKDKDKDSDDQSRDQDRQRAQQQEQRSQEERQRAEQNRQRSQQDQQRARNQQQYGQSGQQSGQRNRQEFGQRDRQQWDDRRGFPQPDRDNYGRTRDQQWNRDQQQYSRSSQQSGRQSDNDAGLGVSIAEDRRDEGLRVIRVHRDSPADEMGLREGDRITHLNGSRIQSTNQFISQIRNMDPGEEIELDVRRDQDERTFRGELESRQEALVLRGGRSRGQQDSWQQDPWQHGRGTRQTGYEEGRRMSQGQQGRSGNTDRQISQIERQLDQLSRQIDNLKSDLRDIRNQSGRSGETTARYDEYRSREEDRFGGTRMSDRSQQEGQRQYDGGRQGQRSYQGNPYQGGERGSGNQGSGQYRGNDSPGGDTGEARLRPDGQ